MAAPGWSFLRRDPSGRLLGLPPQLTESAEGADTVGFFTAEKRRAYPYDPSDDYENIPPTTEVTTTAT